MSKQSWRKALALTLAALCGCTSSLADRLEAEEDGRDAAVADARVPEGDAANEGARTWRVMSVVIDASDQSAPRYYDLDTAREVGEGEGWDLSFRRFQIRMNGGVSGSLDVGARVVEGTPFEDVEQAPQGDYEGDRSDGADDDDAEADNAFNNGKSDWYDYDVSTHTLSSKGLTYVVRSSDARYYKLVLDDYYDAAGSPAILAFRFARVLGPNGEGGEEPVADAGIPQDGATEADAATADAGTAWPSALEVNASDSSTWIYVRLGEGVVSVDDASNTQSWDLAFKRSEVRTNSGTSGSGQGGARLLDAHDFDALATSGTLGFAVDQELTSGAPGAQAVSQNPVLAGWYDYDPATHVVSPGARIYAVRTASGGYAKLQVLAYRGGVYQVRFEPLMRAREVRELDVDASVAGTFAYLDLAQGALVPVAADAAPQSLAWDLGFSRTTLRTNSGTSGVGAGGALEASTSDLAQLTPPSGEAVVDTSVSSGAPGSMPVNANALLGTWYAYDPTTHVVSPRDAAFVVRTAHGGLAGLRILSYQSGVYRVAITYAGPVGSSF